MQRLVAHNWRLKMSEEWKTLVARYADGRALCNCRCAYYTPCGVGIDEQGNHRTDMLACKYGCSANEFTCRNEIAKRVLAELPAVGAA